jgi:hypothetical protein
MVNGTAERIFKRGALRHLIRHSGGIPRRVNVLCHNAMLLAYSGGARMVDTRMVEAAATEYDSLFSQIRDGEKKSDKRIRRWSGRVLESAALRMLVLARRLNPQEIRAFDDRIAVDPDQAPQLDKPGRIAQSH